MTYKQIETSREIRLWIKEIVVPVVSTTAMMVTFIPEVREAVISKAKATKQSIKDKFKKE